MDNKIRDGLHQIIHLMIEIKGMTEIMDSEKGLYSFNPLKRCKNKIVNENIQCLTIYR